MKQNRYLAPVLYLLLSTVLVVLGIHWAQQPPDCLSEEQIAALREEYPVHTDYFNQLIGPIRIPMEKWAILMDTVVYGEVVGGSPHCPTIRVIKDTEHVFHAGDELRLIEGPDSIYHCAVLDIGTKIVTPVSKDRHNSSVSYYRVVTYYVTEDGYLLSVYPESAFAEPSFTGRTLKDYMRTCRMLKHFPSREAWEAVADIVQR